jgi:hypothetical protein
MTTTQTMGGSTSAATKPGCQTITFVNRTDSISMDIMELDPASGKETKTALLTGRNIPVTPSEKVSATIGDEFVIRDDSDNRLLDRVRIGPNRFEPDGAASAAGYLGFERASDSNDWILHTNGAERRLRLQRNTADDVELFDVATRELFYLPVRGGVLLRRQVDRERSPKPTPGAGGQPFRIKPVFTEHRIFVGWTNKPLDSANVRNKRLATEYPSFASYDAMMLEPMRLQNARKGQVFLQLAENDTDYSIVDGDAIVRTGMMLDSTVFGESAMMSRFVSDTKTLATEWSIGVTLGVGDDTTKYSGSASASYKEAFNSLTQRESFWSLTRDKHFSYDIGLDPFIVPVSPDFREAAHALPRPSAATEKALLTLANPAVTDANARDAAVRTVEADPAFAAYTAFIKTWGTHYPTLIRYGWAKFLWLRYDSTRISLMNSKGFNASLEAKGSIKGVPVSGKVEGGYTRTDGFENAMKDELSRAVDTGTESEPQPIEITLAPLSDLLDPAILQDDSIYADWEARAPMLRQAIRKWGHGSADPEDLQLRAFELEVVSFTPTSRADRRELYGWLDIIRCEDSIGPAARTRIWDRSKGSREIFNQNASGVENTWVRSARVMQVFRAGSFSRERGFAACISMIDFLSNTGMGDYKNPQVVKFGWVEERTQLLPGDGPRSGRLTGEWVSATWQIGRMNLTMRARETPMWMVPPEALKTLKPGA